MAGFETECAQAIRPRFAQGKALALGVAQITSLDPPRLADPVSQYFTAGQVREAVFGRWNLALGGACDWPTAFILQTLDRYDLLSPGARGSSFGDAASELAQALAARGILCESRHELDFVWSIRARLLASDLQPLVREMVAALRPGGFAVLVFPFGANAIDRSDIERAAIDLIADAHAVAALKFRGCDHAMTVPFGLVFGHGAR